MYILLLSILVALLSHTYSMGLNRNSANDIFTMPQKSDTSSNDYCGAMVENYRFDCYPEGVTTQAQCEARGCCWGPVSNDLKKGQAIPAAGTSAPWCYFPTNYPDYEVTQYIKTPTGEQLTLTRSAKTAWPGDVMVLQADLNMETENRIHIKIYDPKNQRYEVPIEKMGAPSGHQMGFSGVNIMTKPFGLSIGRGFEGPTIFDTNLVGAPLIFSDQFIQISTRLPSGNIYGLGEHMDKLLINASAGWQRKTFWAKDIGPQHDANLYGTHPFYMGVLPSGRSYGVFFLNSNAMEVDLQPMPALTFRTIGGILDMYIFLAETPGGVIQHYTDLIGRPYLPPYWSLGFHLCRYGYGSSKRLKEIIARNRALAIPYVVQAYTELIGRPYLPPYWSLGFHLCRWGYGSDKNLKAVISRNRALGIPYEVQWTDIDYMDKFKDWTYDPVNYEGLPAIVDDLHANGQKYVIIVDPGISVTQGYAPYDEGMKADIFIKNSTNQPIIGKVWPGETVFPDFFNPKTSEWWYNQAKGFHDKLAFDGLWTDMNEPSSSGYGSIYGCTDDNLDKPPYTPGVVGGSLAGGTLCPSAKQFLSTHYNLHSLYGYSEVKVTQGVLEKIRDQRSLVISRSSYPGTGYHGGHWSGDIESTWEHLVYSIPEMLRFQMFGIPLVGADVCGFRGDTTEELCTRWMQLGAFYPFMRNHNSLQRKDQDPGAFSATAQAAMKSALELRYTLLPYLYTLFFNSHMQGSTVARPMFFVYPGDPVTYSIDQQFFWGDGLLISPVLTQGATKVNAYFNATDSYYCIKDGSPILNGGWQTLDAPLDTIRVHVRGGSIIPTQEPAITTVKSRMNQFGLLVALTQSASASKPAYAEGELIWDDGDSLNTLMNKTYTQITFKANEHSLTSQTVIVGYDDPTHMVLGSVSLMGLNKAPTIVMVNGAKATFEVYTYYVLVNLKEHPVSLLEQPLQMEWV